MKIGDKIRDRIDEAIYVQEKLLLLLSEHAIASAWVEDEVEAALEKEQRQQREVLFPVRLDKSVMQTSAAWARMRHLLAGLIHRGIRERLSDCSGILRLEAKKGRERKKTLMANPEHFHLLRQGTATWEKWRHEYPDVRPDFRGIHFREAFLQGDDIPGDVIIQLQCEGSNFSKADFSGSHLDGSSFSYANFSGAIFHETNLSRLILRGADFTRADFTHAILKEVDLKEANFSNAYMGWTTFGNLDLSEVRGLDAVKHRGPSTIGLDTIYRSRGVIPELFLRQAGVPVTFLTNMQALVESISPIEFYSCFISYSRQNKDFAEQLYTDLQSKGVRCWFDSKDLKIGDHYHQSIDESIRLYDKLVLILSEQAIQSAWVEREVVAAREKEDREQRLVLFPLRLDDAVMGTTKAWAADVRRRWHIGDFTRWKDHDTYQQAFERLLRDLKAEQEPEA